MDIRMTFFEAMMGLLGQNITCDSDRVWVCKTHYPYNAPACASFIADKMIVIARNPLDVFPSFANLSNLHSHSLQIEGEYQIDYPDFWQEWVTA